MFFRRKPAAPPTETEPASAAAQTAPSDDDIDALDAEGVPEGEGGPEEYDRHWRERAAAVLPGAASTGSKRPEALFGDDQAPGPMHYVRASGCTITTVGGAELVDCTMALGAVAIGYADEVVVAAVADAASRGHVSGLSPILEVELAERLSSVIPCAEQVRFLKTGAEAVAAAVRIARAHTGRDVVIGSGYFGWLDWSSDVAGVPAGVKSDFVRVPFDDVEALARAVKAAGNRLAAIVLEPVVERFPSTEWVQAARRHCDDLGAVLVFDEIKTGFRLRPGGYQEYSGITPDLATFGKAIANGFPLAVVAGREAVMQAARRSWISSTLASETTALAAANAVLDWHEQVDVCESLARIGADMRAAVQGAIEASGVAGVRVEGIDPMWLLRFDDPRREARFLELAREYGVLFKRGAYNFAALAHEGEPMAAVERAASSALVQLRQDEEAA